MSDEGNKAVKPNSLLGVRHVQALLLFLAMLLAFGMRVNMSMAIVAMTDPHNDDSFDWSTQRQSVILSSFFWGYIVLQIPGGELAKKFGGKILIICSVGINSAVSLLIPIGAYYGGWQLVCGCRVLQGLSQAFLLPSVHCLIGQWIPLEEKSRLGMFIYAGCQMGTAIQLIVSGVIAQHWGWPAIFYVCGALGALWTVVYMFLGSKSPQTSGYISDQERSYIETSLGHVGERKKLKTPWKDILTSMPFYALIAAHCGQNWGFWTLMTEMPSYMNQILGVDITSNGIMSALPYLTMFVAGFPLGFLSDYVLRKKWLSTTACRKISNCIGHWGPAIALIGLSYSPPDVTIAVTILSIVVGLNAGYLTGYLLVHIDMAPNFAGTLMGITNCIANIFSLCAPLVAGAILKDQTNEGHWRIVFYLSSFIYITFNLFFVIFGTSERQHWNEPKMDDNEIGAIGEKEQKVV